MSTLVTTLAMTTLVTDAACSRTFLIGRAASILITHVVTNVVITNVVTFLIGRAASILITHVVANVVITNVVTFLIGRAATSALSRRCSATMAFVTGSCRRVNFRSASCAHQHSRYDIW
jgi:hypothetical protein